MPLAFESLSHGQIAFGFFNIETDLLLLDVHFFFADDFVQAVRELAANPGDRRVSVSLVAYTLNPSRIGNLMGSLHGIDFRGFIGEVYKRYPFPKEEEKFRQQPEGFRNRGIIEAIIGKYARLKPIIIVFDPARDTLDIGGYIFDRSEFHRLILYVWAGGYPRWRDGLRPDYVREMKRTIEGSENAVFAGLEFTE
ncbi:MAG: hypothetical protein H6Q52_1420 [Deltaproteobacteria bacterium]|nr:hypothetical protein [Deltaproteobacteria bacterium]